MTVDLLRIVKLPLALKQSPDMTLLFIRHGETALNAARVLQPAATPLSARGLAQAQAVAERLATQRLAGVLSSDLPRALQTAQAIAAAQGGLVVQTTPLLQERNFGDLRGLPYDSLPWDPIVSDRAPPGGEAMDTFLARVQQAFDHALALQRQLGGVLAVVSHGLVIRALLGRQVALPPGMAEAPRIANTSVTVVGIETPHRAERVDCTEHLRGRVGEDGHSLSGG